MRILNGLIGIFIVLSIYFMIIYASDITNDEINDSININNNTVRDDDIDSHEDEAIQEIIHLQQIEEEEYKNLELNRLNDEQIAAEAEKLAKEKELSEKRQQNERNRAYSNVYSSISSNTESNQHDDIWIKRSRPGMSSNSQLRSTSNTISMKSSSNQHITSSNEYKQKDINELINKMQSSHSNPLQSDDYSKISKPRHSSLSDLENRFIHSNIQNKFNYNQDMKSDYINRLLKYQYSRHLARPIERIISIYNNDDQTYYDIFNIKPSLYDSSNYINEKLVKQIYRNQALLIHPDKNSHMDANDAFDILQEAYNTLMNPIQRSEYNNQLKLKYKRKRLSYKKLIKWYNDTILNLSSRWLLFLHRIQHGEWNIEWNEFIQQPKQFLLNILYKLQHFSLLPTCYDRIVMLHEIIWDHLKWISYIMIGLTLVIKQGLRQTAS